MSGWREWSTQNWSERLLEYFFRRRDGIDTTVSSLLVTAEELARVAGAPQDCAKDVRDAFVDAVCRAARQDRDVLEDASDYDGWPGLPNLDVCPPFVAHLLFTCVAASESSEDLADEASFLSRLRALSQNQQPDKSLHMLPQLWTNLAAWLDENASRYRRLHLPDLGGYARIGHTIKLAFPDRRDQLRLSDLLDRAGLAGQEPPAGRVLSAIASERARFGRAFLDAFDDFRRSFDTHGAAKSARLVEHQFWAVVREAALRGRGQLEISELGANLTILCEDQDDHLALFIVANKHADISTLGFIELPFSYGSWRFALIPEGAGLDASNLDIVARNVLARTLLLPQVSNQVEQGLLPLFVGAHGLLELAQQQHLEEASVALVRNDVLPDFLRIFGSRAKVRKAAYEGWTQVHEVDLRPLPSAEFEGTTLSKSWIVHELLFPTSIRLLGGVRADDGWLGSREVLPRVVVSCASNVVLVGPHIHATLTRTDDGDWCFPSSDFSGEFTLFVSREGGVDEQRTIRFHSAPAAEAYKIPSDPDAWIVEGLGGTGLLSNGKSSCCSTEPGCDDCVELCGRVAYLGADLGSFVTARSDAAWCVTHFGGKFMAARGNVPDADAYPVRQVDDAHARSRWRKMLFDGDFSWSDSTSSEIRRQIKARTSSYRTLPKVDVEQTVPALTLLRLPSSAASADRLVQILSGRASTRAGIDWREWQDLTQRVLCIDARQLAGVTRAWMEAGLLDVASFARWRHRAVFVRQPRLIGFRIGEHVGATLSGLVLPTTRDDVYQNARSLGALVEEKTSICSCVPSTLAFCLPNGRTLENLGRACRLDVAWIDLNARNMAMENRHDGTSEPPSHYEYSTRWLRWSLTEGEYPQVLVEHRARRDRPDYWFVACGDRTLWSYDLNVARLWAAMLMDARPVRVVDESFLEVVHAYLPLPLARIINVIGIGLAGPAVAGHYRYPTSSRCLREFALEVLRQILDHPNGTEPSHQQPTG